MFPIKQAPHFFTENQIRKLLSIEKLSPRDKAILTLFVSTGLRSSELLALNFDDVDENWVYVRNGKGGKARIVPLTLEAKRVLEPVLLRCYELKSPVFVNQLDGERLSRRGLHRIVTAHMKAAGLKGSCHSLRHTAAVRWLGAGLTLPEVQILLGHSLLSSTGVYLKVPTQGLLQKFQNCMSKLAA